MLTPGHCSFMVKALDECRRKNKAHGEDCQVEKDEENSVFNFHHLPSMTQ